MTDIPVPPVPPVPPQSQVSAPHTPPPQPPRDLVTPGMIEALKKTKPWVRFLSILGFILAGLMVLVALGMLVFGLYQMTQGPGVGAWMAGMSVLYLLLGILYLFPSRYLYQYASAIGAALDAKYKSGPVEQALGYQKSFWKFAGIMALVMLLLYIPGIFAAIAIPNLLTAMQRSKAKRSMADMRSIASALEARATDTNSYPPTQSIGELERLLKPTYMKEFPRADGWGSPYVYEGIECAAEDRCAGYMLGSPGEDGKVEGLLSYHTSDVLGESTNFAEDIVFTNGKFIRAPEGLAGGND